MFTNRTTASLTATLFAIGHHADSEEPGPEVRFLAHDLDALNPVK